MNISIKSSVVTGLLMLSVTLSVFTPHQAVGEEEKQLQRNLKGRNDRPYDSQLLRLAELLGSIHYLRELCGANDGQVWRDQMSELVKAEGTTPVRRVNLVNSFNKGYRGYRRTYRSCTDSARLAVSKSMKESASIASAIVAENP